LYFLQKIMIRLFIEIFANLYCKPGTTRSEIYLNERLMIDCLGRRSRLWQNCQISRFNIGRGSISFCIFLLLFSPLSAISVQSCLLSWTEYLILLIYLEKTQYWLFLLFSVDEINSVSMRESVIFISILFASLFSQWIGNWFST